MTVDSLQVSALNFRFLTSRDAGVDDARGLRRVPAGVKQFPPRDCRWVRRGFLWQADVGSLDADRSDTGFSGLQVGPMQTSRRRTE
ncbi:hypothetical protein AVEN_189207-1 [Araneus ventricosus]|uniref:Uncharacterized protein n=1 Tax=Araneus ventricosus TaxID=182803 RepID=A0A4Y2TF05_ARAVE|nr:hypothetical protein AVEN_189207-1 [Araneus ventricosus]